MKLLIMLAAIYALIINQSLKQKETKNATPKVSSSDKNLNIKPGSNIYFNTVFKPNLTAIPTQVRVKNSSNKDLTPTLYQEHLFPTMNDYGGNTQQELFSPLNYSYSPVEKERSR